MSLAHTKETYLFNVGGAIKSFPEAPAQPTKSTGERNHDFLAVSQ